MMRTILKRIYLIVKTIKYLFSPSFLYTLYINFHYLPFRQAVKLPIILRNTSIRGGRGEILIDSDHISFGMIRIGGMGRNLWCRRKKSYLDLRNGRMVFKGVCRLWNGISIRVSDDAYLEFGNQCEASSGLNLVAYYKVVIGDNAKIGWDCTIIDTDFHPLYDIYSHKDLKIYAPILIGKGCWVGFKSVIMKGTSLADYTTISSSSVVKCKVKDPYKVLSGNPAIEVAEGFQIREETFHSYPRVIKRAYM